MVDYIVVGLGLAGISFCEVLEKHHKTYTVISDASQSSSTVAGGLYNPVILKRFTAAWNAKEQLETALPFYKGLEEKLGVQLDYKIPVLRRFSSVEEQNMWFEAADKPGLKPFLSSRIYENANPAISAPFGYGEVLNTGRIDTKMLVSAYAGMLMKKGFLQQDTFNFEALHLHPDGVEYQGQKAKNIVFATGFGLLDDPYFNYLPLNGTKGELLTISAPDLKEKNVIKSSVFIIPMGADQYRVGATYEWKDKTQTPTAAARTELLKKLDTFLTCSYQVVDQVAGIRPTVADRRPLVGLHPKYQHLCVLNGFGSRGVMIAPFAAKQLYHAIEDGTAIHPEMDIVRFKKRFLSL